MTVGIIHSVDPETSLKQRAPRLQTVPFLPAQTGKKKSAGLQSGALWRIAYPPTVSAFCGEGENISGEGRRINAGKPLHCCRSRSDRRP